jgi:hypothetical protein
MIMDDPIRCGLPSTGSVLGVDVGFSPTRRSSAVCRLDWDDRWIAWSIQRFRAQPAEMAATITAVAGGRKLEAAAFDGPLQPGFEPIGHYRTAERMLTRRIGIKISKPGQSHAPMGKLLNQAANKCVRLVLDHCDVAPARHGVPIDARAVVEAFPTGFLGLMLEQPSLIVAVRSDRSDVYFRFLAKDGTLRRLALHLLPGRAFHGSLDEVINHDDRAAWVCALTALCVAAGDFTAVGDANGWIILPPRAFTAGWARDDLEVNARETGCVGSYYCAMLTSAAGPP